MNRPHVAKLVLALVMLISFSTPGIAQDIGFRGLQFRSQTVTSPAPNVISMQDSTWIGYDSSIFRSLLFTTAKVEMDTAAPASSFKIYAPFVLMARVGTGTYQPVWEVATADTISVSISDLLSATGYALTSAGSSIMVAGVPFKVNRIYFSGKPTDALTNNSYISANGQFILPETAQKITHPFNGPDRVRIHDTANVAPTFSAPIIASFIMNHLSFSPNGLQLKFDAASGRFSLYGGATITVDSSSVKCTLGDSNNPGIVFENGAVQQIALDVQDTFTLKRLKLSPKDLSIYYSKASSEYRMYGALDVKLAQDTISIQLGDSTAPGCTIQNGSVQEFLASLNGRFKLKGLSFIPKPLSLKYNKPGSQFGLYGSTWLVIGGDSLDLTVGDASNPGFVIKDGALQDMELGITTDFSLKSIAFHPRGTTLGYSKDQNRFSIYGAIDANFQNNAIDMDLGTASAPGLLINASTGDLEKLDLTTSDTFKLYSMVLAPTDFHFQYDKADARYEMWGKMDALLTQDTIHLQLGDSTMPGFLWKNGQLQNLTFGITDSFKLFGLKMDPQSLTCAYSGGNSKQYKIFGGLDVFFDTDTVHANLGDSTTAGINIIDGAVSNVDLLVNGAFKVKSLDFAPSNLRFRYDKDSSYYEMFGTVDCKLAQDSLHLVLGDSIQPGVVIQTGSLKSLNANIQGNFSLKGLTFKPTPLSLAYDRSNNQYEIFGSSIISIATDTIILSLGDTTNPAFKIQGGILQDANMGITSDFSLKGLEFHPRSASISYSKQQNKFSAYGGLDAKFGGNVIDVDMGTLADPGLVINSLSRDLEKLKLTTNDTFKLYNLVLEPTDFHFEYDKDSIRYEIWGAMDALVSQDTIHLAMGDSTTPGLILKQGVLQKLNFGITSDFNLFGLQMNPHQLTCVYDGGPSKKYVMYGGLDVAFDADSIKVKMGDQSSPGLSIEDGVVTSIGLDVDGDFNIGSMNFAPQNLAFRYDSDSAYYEMYGGMHCKVSQDSMSLALGDSVLPGLVIRSGSLQHLEASIAGNFKLSGLAFRPAPLYFAYDKNNSQYKVYGEARIGIQSDSLELSLGDTSNPGLLLKNGKLDNLNLGITGDFSLKGLSFKPNQTRINYRKAENQFAIYGTLDAAFDGNIIDIVMGDSVTPGLVINTASGDVSYINMTTTDTFKLYSLVLEPSNLHFQYDATDLRYEMWGNLNAYLGKDTIAMRLGDSTLPGLLLKNGELQNLNLGISTDFRVAGLEFKPENLTCVYQSSPAKQYAIYGGLDVKFENNTINAKLGDSTTPGFTIVNGAVEEINIGVDGNFSIAGLAFAPKGLTFHYDRDSNEYEMYGSMSFTLEGESMDVDMGTATDPGLVVENGQLEDFNFAVNSEFKLGGLAVQTQGLGVRYNRANTQRNYDHYLVRGKVSVNELWSISAELGKADDPNTGLELDIEPDGKCKVIVDDFTIDAKNVAFGGVTFNDIHVDYGKPSGGEYKIDVAMDVSFPAGFEVGAGLGFEKDANGKLVVDSIGIDFKASGGNPGIEIPETGIFIVELGGEVYKNPEGDYEFGGLIALSLGGNFDIAGTNCEMLRISGQVDIDKDHLNIKDQVYLAAYQRAGQWTGLLGQGMVELDLNWHTGYYVVNGEVDVLGPPATFVKFLTEASYHKNGTLSASGEADVIVPDFIPLIGGKTLARVDAAIRYKKDDLNNSEAAGWMDLDLGKKITVGIEYNFGKNKVKKIGQSDVDDIQSGVASDADHRQAYYYSFDVGQNVSAVTLHLSPVSKDAYNDFLLRLGDMSIDDNGFDREGWMIEMQTPDVNSSSVNLLYQLRNAVWEYWGIHQDEHTTAQYPDFTIGVDSVTYKGIAFHFQSNTIDEGETLTPGRYTLSCNWQNLLDVFEVELQQHYAMPENPFIEVTPDPLGQGVRVNTDVRIYVADTPAISYYYNTAPNYNGAIYKTVQLPGEVQDVINIGTYLPTPVDSITVFDTATSKWLKKPVSTNKQYYFYTAVRDGVNKPVFSNIQGPFSLGPAVNVTITPTKPRFINMEAMVDLMPTLVNGQSIDPASTIAVYYDFDTMGYDGFEVPNMNSLSLQQVRWGISIPFVVSSIDDPRFRAGVYFYSIIRTSSGQLLKMPYTNSPLKIQPPLNVSVTYNNLNMQAAGVRVWLDQNNNGIYDGGRDLVLTTDQYGNCLFPYTWENDITVGLLLDGPLERVNATSVVVKRLPATDKSPKHIDFYINYAPIKVGGKLTISVDRIEDNSNQILLFADLNGNMSHDNNEPMIKGNATTGYDFEIAQPVFDIVYVTNRTSIMTEWGDNYANLDVVWNFEGQNIRDEGTYNQQNWDQKRYKIRIDHNQRPRDSNLQLDINLNYN